MSTPTVALPTADLLQRAQAALWKSPLFSLRNVRVEKCDNSALQIRGRVATYFQKQQAQEIVRAAVNDVAIVNNIEVT